MSFERALTIKEAIDHIHRKRYLLPAIQREFIWDAEQMEKLFDSLMRDYPIGSFLFWQIEKENIGKFQFYEFVRNYHERDHKHNPKAAVSGDEAITAILDGQQRLTALYIGLKGTYQFKLPRKRWESDDAFPKRELCMNLLSPSDEFGIEYNFQFVTTDEYTRRDENTFWFKVGDILKFEDSYEVSNFIIENNLAKIEEEKAKYANKTLYLLYKLIHDNELIHYYLEKDDSLDKVLNIFIRVNSGGTQLSYSDLLLSIATAQWKERDAREEITSFVDEINKIGDGFNFNKDFVLKACLVLCDFTDIAFKADNFNSSNMDIIEKEWKSISRAIRLSVLLVSSFGFQRDTLTSNNALIPIAYYLYKNKMPDNFAESSIYINEKNKILKWLTVALLKRTFGGVPDNVLRPIRQVISENDSGFPLYEIIERLKPTTKAMAVSDDEINNFLGYQYGQKYTFSILALLFPTLDFRNKFHIDHIFPKKLFTKYNLEKNGIYGEKQNFHLNHFNAIANLQLLEGVPNQEKAGTDFKSWLHDKYHDNQERHDFMKKHYIPDANLSFDNFDTFIKERKNILRDVLKSMLSSDLRDENNSKSPISFNKNESDKHENSVNSIPEPRSEMKSQERHIVTYLLTWNPIRWDMKKNREFEQQIRKGEPFRRHWSCGKIKDIKKGDRVFIIRLGKEPKGIFASGRVIEESYQDEHWEIEKLENGIKTNFIKVQFDVLLDPNKEKILTYEQLNEKIPNLWPPLKVRWRSQFSGYRVPENIVIELEEMWQQLILSEIMTNEIRLL